MPTELRVGVRAPNLSCYREIKGAIHANYICRSLNIVVERANNRNHNCCWQLEWLIASKMASFAIKGVDCKKKRLIALETLNIANSQSQFLRANMAITIALYIQIISCNHKCLGQSKLLSAIVKANCSQNV